MIFPIEIKMELQYEKLTITFAAIKENLPIVSAVTCHWVRSEINQPNKA